MRIVSGIYGGRVLSSPKDQSIRPTSDKIRGAIFNALGSRIDLEGVRVLDCFAGSGALGLEALSRGATHCTFFDKSRTSLSLCKANINALDTNDKTRTKAKDSANLPNNIEDTYGLVFIDPPYNQDMITPCLNGLHQGNWLNDDALLVIETEKNWQGDLPDAYKLDTQKTYGDTLISYVIYSKTPE